MSVRKISVKLGVAALATAGLTFTALAPANAAGEDSWYQLSNSGYADGTDLPSGSIIGAGSDTIQFVDGALAKAYDATSPTSPMVSLSACYEPGSTEADGKTVTPGSTIQTSCTYPTGATYPFTEAGKSLGSIGAGTSGDGANLLDKSGVTQTDVAFARTSGPKDQANLGLFPFALDQVVAVVSNNVPSNAPATLTRAELYGIYSGYYTNWDQLGGNDAPIHAYYPYNPSSGTLSAFYGQLDLESPQGTAAGANVIVPSSSVTSTGSFVSNTAVNDSSLVDNGEAGQPIVEHDPAAIENDPDAVAPFSYSRIIMDESTSGDPTTSPIKALSGWVLDRAVYNEVRDYNTTPAGSLSGVNPDWIANDPSTEDSPANIVNSLFGTSGYLCSAPAASIMEQYGFYQLDSGTCGVEVHGTPSSLDAVDAPSQTTTTATVESDGSTVDVKVVPQDADDNGIPTGNVTVSYIQPKSGSGTATTAAPAPVTVPLGADGTATIPVPSDVPSGKWQIAVAYAGDSNYQASWSDDETGTTPGTIIGITDAQKAAQTQLSTDQDALSSALNAQESANAAVSTDRRKVAADTKALKTATTRWNAAEKALKNAQKADKRAKGKKKAAADRKVTSTLNNAVSKATALGKAGAKLSTDAAALSAASAKAATASQTVTNDQTAVIADEQALNAANEAALSGS